MGLQGRWGFVGAGGHLVLHTCIYVHMRIPLRDCIGYVGVYTHQNIYNDLCLYTYICIYVETL